MAKYFSTYYLNETVFQQQEEQESSKKYFIRYLNSFLMALAVVNFFLKESTPPMEKQLVRRNSSSPPNKITPIKTSIIPKPLVEEVKGTSLEKDIVEENNKNYYIHIKFLIPIKEKDISLFLSDVLEHLILIHEDQAFIEVKRNTNGVVEGITINDIKNSKNSQDLFEQIQHDKNILVTTTNQ